MDKRIAPAHQVLALLKQNLLGFVSGEAVSEVLGVSRTAVWKYINELKKDGYEIESSTRKGYKLVSTPDLNAEEIRYQLGTCIIGRDIHYFDTIDSTNDYAKKAAYEGCREGTVVIAGNQTAGRGRLGRSWDASEHKSISMSIVLRPEISPEDIQAITLAASVAVVKGIKRVAGVEAGIKWPNDIILGGKKVCGILTEMNSEVQRVNYIVLGIGINVNQEEGDFPEELRDKATSLKMYGAAGGIMSQAFRRSDIVRGILFELERIYGWLNNGDLYKIIDCWKKYSVTLGKKVRVTSRSSQYVGTAEDVTPDGKLLVRCDDGTLKEIISGEISVRGLMGYS